MRYRRARRAALGTTCAAALAVLACDGSADPVPGALTATLISPHGAEGAAYLTLFGPGISGVSAFDAHTFSHAVGDTVHVVLVRDVPGDLRFIISVADTTSAPAVLIVEVAGGDNRLRPDPSAYRVELRP